MPRPEYYGLNTVVPQITNSVLADRVSSLAGPGTFTGRRNRR